MKKFTAIFTLLMFVSFALVANVSVFAQSTSTEIPVDQLPEGVVDQFTTTSEETSSSAGAESSASRTQDFITGILIGAGLGLVVGGGTIWFTKKG